ncbi:MAG: PqqD family peptide modification chaperone [Desulfobulbaceae bacterium]|jgi:hypothetical protein|nr:PqqD family peptide modification chaperone [Desulfobulbaceae bacterium]
MKISAEQYICRVKGKLSTELDGETVILDMESGGYLGLDEVGTCIWNNIAEDISVKKLVEILLAEFDVAEDVCWSDLELFLSDMVENNLIHLSCR